MVVDRYNNFEEETAEILRTGSTVAGACPGGLYSAIDVYSRITKVIS